MEMRDYELIFSFTAELFFREIWLMLTAFDDFLGSIFK